MSRRTFDGKSRTGLIAAIVDRDPKAAQRNAASS